MHIPASEKAAFRSVRAELIIEFCAGAHFPQRENSSHGRSDKSNNKESLSRWRHASIFHALQLFKRRTLYTRSALKPKIDCGFAISPHPCICLHPVLRPPFVRIGWGLAPRERERRIFSYIFYWKKAQREDVVWWCPQQIYIEMIDVKSI